MDINFRATKCCDQHRYGHYSSYAMHWTLTQNTLLGLLMLLLMAEAVKSLRMLNALLFNLAITKIPGTFCVLQTTSFV